MAKKVNPTTPPYQTYPGRSVEQRMDNVMLLPGVHRSTRNQKYLDALLGDLTSKGTLESFDGWVGTKSGRINRKTDIYLSGRGRFDAGIKSGKIVGDLTDVANEIEAIEAIRFKDAKQMSSKKSYGYNPDVDPDKIVNYSNYHWVPYDLPEIMLDAGFNDDDTPAYVDIVAEIVGQTYYVSKKQANGRKLTLRNGMKLYFVQRGNGTFYNSANFITVPSDSLYPSYFMVEGVGTSIKLLPYDAYGNPLSPLASLAPVPWDKKPWDSTAWDTDVLIAGGKQYVTIARGSINYNAWSRTNRWFHEQTIAEVARFLGIEDTEIRETAARATRPIVEFDHNICLFNHGHLGKAAVDVITDGIISVAAFEGTVRPKLDGHVLANGDRILSVAGAPGVKNRTFVVYDVETGATLIPAGDADPVEGQSVLVKSGLRGTYTFHYDGNTWVKSQQLTERGQAPLFDIFDTTGTPMSQFNVSAFYGNKIFGYAPGTNYDRELNLSIAFDSNYKGAISANTGSILMQNFLAERYKNTTGSPGVIVDIPTENYYRIWNDVSQSWKYEMGWKPVSETFAIRSDYTITATKNLITQNGNMTLIGDRWAFNPEYDWNILSSPLSETGWRLEERSPDMPSKSWYGNMMLSRLRDNRIWNHSGKRLQIATQRGVVFIDTNDTIVSIPTSTFAPRLNYGPTNVRPSDYIVRWRLGNTGQWNTANLLGRMKDDVRRPDIYINGKKLTTNQWGFVYETLNDPTTPTTGTIIYNVAESDIIDFTVNGSMTNLASSATNVSNLTDNPYNETFVTGSYGRMFQHWISAIKQTAIPLFVNDYYHADTQYPRFSGDGDSQAFGDNDWSFANITSQPTGSYILKHDHPADRYFWATRSGEKGSVFALMEDARKSYGNFKLKLLQKINQLHDDGPVYDIPATVDRALSDIFVGRDDTFRYAYSHMAMWGTPKSQKIYQVGTGLGLLDGGTSAGQQSSIDGGTAPSIETYVIDAGGALDTTQFSLTMDIPGSPTLDEIASDHVYVYYKADSSVSYKMLTYTKDYEIDQDLKRVVVTGSFEIPGRFLIKVYSKSKTSFIPPTPSKIGALPWYQPGLVIDESYTAGPVTFIQGHDGSLTPAWGDFRDDMLLEYENRVASSIGKERGARAEIIAARMLPKRYRPTWYNRVELNNYLEDHWLTWANENNIALTPNEGQVNGHPFTYNYSQFTPLVDSNTYGSWREIYTHLFGTDRPHTHPWEMLGFKRKPAGWDGVYNWTDPAKRIALLTAVALGDRSLGAHTDTDPVFSMFYSLETHMPVDFDGNLLNPIQAGLYDAAIVNSELAKTRVDWTFGQMGPQEIAWRRSSDYQYALATWLILAGGPSYLEEIWEGPRNIPSLPTPDINIDRKYLRISKWAASNQHRETSTDIVPGFGMLVNELAASALGTNLDDVISETRNIQTKMQWTAYGFLDSSRLDFLADILIEQDKGTRLPQENYAVDLKITSPTLVLNYSGVKVIADASGGYRIDGYDNRATYFSYYPVDIQKDSIPVTIGKINYKKYLYFTDTVSYMDYGTVLKSRQDVINFLLGYGQYLESVGWLFENMAATEDERLDWGYSAREFATWSQTRWEPNTQIALSPASQDLVLSHTSRFFGRLDTTFLARTFLLDENSVRIEFKDTEVMRDNDRTTIRSRPGKGIYFVRCGLEEYTHAVTFDNVTIFNDIINDELFGLRVGRLRAQGLRTKNWDGRPKGNGYVILGDGVLGNFDTISREIGDDYITIENRSSNPWIADLKKAQQGEIVPNNVLINTQLSRDTIDRFEAAALRRMGTAGLIQKFAKGLYGESKNSQGLPYNAGLKINEDWMFRMGEDYGNVGDKITWEIQLPPGSRDTLLDMFTVRSIPAFVSNTYYEALRDRAADNIVDLLGPKDKRWVRHPSDFRLPLRSADIQDGDLPQAGVADRLEADYKFMDIDGLSSIDLSDEIMSDMNEPTRWDSTAKYQEGAQVRYKGQLFNCVSAHLASTTFNEAQWTPVEEPFLPRIWLANNTPDSNDIRDWTMYQVMDQNLGIKDLCAGTVEDPYHPLVTMLPGIKHHMQVDDWILVLSTEKAGLNGFYKVSEIIDSENFHIELLFNPVDFIPPEFPPGTVSMDGKLFPVRKVHFYTIDEMNATIEDPRYEWRDGMMAYIDDRVNDAQIFQFDGNYTLFDGRALSRDNRAVLFYELPQDNVLYQDMASDEEYMPWLFAIGMIGLTFKALAAGTIALTDQCTVSLNAVNAPAPTIRNFNNVPTITVADALRGLIFRQFNDCAVVLAEKIYGNVSTAVTSMNAWFQDSCSAESANVTTSLYGTGNAYDLGNVAKYIWTTYASNQTLFSEPSWFYQGTIYPNRSKLILRNDGVGFLAMQNTVPVTPENPLGVEYHQIGIKNYGSRQLMLVSVGYISDIKRDSDALVLLNTINVFGNSTGTFNPVPFYLDRRITNIVDQSRITKVEVVDYEKNQVLAVLEPYDPAAGILPGYVDQYIDWKSSYDPANYTDADSSNQQGYTVRPRYAWYDSHVGEVWWDLSTVRYYDYYQGSTRERAFQWGKQFPGSSIDMYEWVRTTVPPSQWVISAATGFLVDFEHVSGSPYHVMVDNEPKYFWSERQEKDTSGVIRTFYYFWVKGMDRTISARRVIRETDVKLPSGSVSTTYTSSPASAGPAPSKITVTQVASAVDNPRVSGARWFAGLQSNAILLSGIGDLLQNPKVVLRIQADATADEHAQWLLLKDGDPLSIIPDWLHVRLRDSLIGTDQTITVYDYAAWTRATHYNQGDVVTRDGKYYRAFRTFIDADVTYLDGSPVQFVKQPWQRLYDVTVLSPTQLSEVQGKSVPDYDRSPYDRWGNEIRPTQQSWIRDRIEAIRTFVDVANVELASFPVTNIAGWDNRIKRLIPTQDPTLVYDMTNYWNYADYVSETYDPEKAYSAKFTDFSQLYNDTSVPVGGYASLRVGAQQLLHVWERLQDGWKIVFQRLGTIQLNKKLFDVAKQLDLWDTSPWDSLRWDNYPFFAIAELITALRYDIMVDDHQVSYNRIFFALTREVMKQNPACHWIRKSTYIDVERINDTALTQDPYFRKEALKNDDNVLTDYVDQVKPYHSKVLNQIEVDQLIESSHVYLNDSHTAKVAMRIEDFGDQIWKGAYLDGHPFNHLQEGWSRNPWDFDFVAKGMLPATGEDVSRPKVYAWDMDQPKYTALIDTIANGYSFGLPPGDLQKVIDGNKFYQPDIDEWPRSMIPITFGDGVEIRVMNNPTGDIVNEYTVAWRYHVDIFGGTTVYRYNNEARTTLAAELKQADTEIVLAEASILSKPDPVNGKPGVIWVAFERIEFWEIDGNLLKQLVRGTLGTGVPDVHAAGRLVYDGGQQNQLPTPDEITNWKDSLYPMWNDTGITLQDSENREALFLKEKPGSFRT